MTEVKNYGTSVKAEYFLYKQKYLLIRIPLTFVKFKLRIVVYVSLYYLINKLKSIQSPTDQIDNVEDCSFQKKRVWAYNSIKIPCQIIKFIKKTPISGDIYVWI